MKDFFADCPSWLEDKEKLTGKIAASYSPEMKRYGGEQEYW